MPLLCANVVYQLIYHCKIMVRAEIILWGMLLFGKVEFLGSVQ